MCVSLFRRLLLMASACVTVAVLGPEGGSEPHAFEAAVFVITEQLLNEVPDRYFDFLRREISQVMDLKDEIPAKKEENGAVVNTSQANVSLKFDKTRFHARILKSGVRATDVLYFSVSAPGTFRGAPRTFSFQASYAVDANLTLDSKSEIRSNVSVQLEKDSTHITITGGWAGVGGLWNTLLANYWYNLDNTVSRIATDMVRNSTKRLARRLRCDEWRKYEPPFNLNGSVYYKMSLGLQPAQFIRSSLWTKVETDDGERFVPQSRLTPLPKKWNMSGVLSDGRRKRLLWSVRISRAFVSALLWASPAEILSAPPRTYRDANLTSSGRLLQPAEASITPQNKIQVSVPAANLWVSCQRSSGNAITNGSNLVKLADVRLKLLKVDAHIRVGDALLNGRAIPSFLLELSKPYIQDSGVDIVSPSLPVPRDLLVPFVRDFLHSLVAGFNSFLKQNQSRFTPDADTLWYLPAPEVGIHHTSGADGYVQAESACIEDESDSTVKRLICSRHRIEPSLLVASPEDAPLVASTGRIALTEAPNGTEFLKEWAQAASYADRINQSLGRHPRKTLMAIVATALLGLLSSLVCSAYSKLLAEFAVTVLASGVAFYQAKCWEIYDPFESFNRVNLEVFYVPSSHSLDAFAQIFKIWTDCGQAVLLLIAVLLFMAAFTCAIRKVDFLACRCEMVWKAEGKTEDLKRPILEVESSMDVSHEEQPGKKRDKHWAIGEEGCRTLRLGLCVAAVVSQMVFLFLIPMCSLVGLHLAGVEVDYQGYSFWALMKSAAVKTDHWSRISNAVFTSVFANFLAIHFVHVVLSVPVGFYLGNVAFLCIHEALQKTSSKVDDAAQQDQQYLHTRGVAEGQQVDDAAQQNQQDLDTRGVAEDQQVDDAVQQDRYLSFTMVLLADMLCAMALILPIMFISQSLSFGRHQHSSSSSWWWRLVIAYTVRRFAMVLLHRSINAGKLGMRSILSRRLGSMILFVASCIISWLLADMDDALKQTGVFHLQSDFIVRLFLSSALLTAITFAISWLHQESGLNDFCVQKVFKAAPNSSRASDIFECILGVLRSTKITSTVLAVGGLLEVTTAFIYHFMLVIAMALGREEDFRGIDGCWRSCMLISAALACVACAVYYRCFHKRDVTGLAAYRKEFLVVGELHFLLVLVHWQLMSDEPADGLANLLNISHINPASAGFLRPAYTVWTQRGRWVLYGALLSWVFFLLSVLILPSGRQSSQLSRYSVLLGGFSFVIVSMVPVTADYVTSFPMEWDTCAHCRAPHFDALVRGLAQSMLGTMVGVFLAGKIVVTVFAFPIDIVRPFCIMLDEKKHNNQRKKQDLHGLIVFAAYLIPILMLFPIALFAQITADPELRPKVIVVLLLPSFLLQVIKSKDFLFYVGWLGIYMGLLMWFLWGYMPSASWFLKNVDGPLLWSEFHAEFCLSSIYLSDMIHWGLGQAHEEEKELSSSGDHPDGISAS